MVDRLIFHVGTHKTGSTALQASLAGASPRLLERGILYPRAGRGNHPGHANLFWEQIGSRKWEPESGGYGDLLAEIRSATPNVVIVSSEGFSHPDNSADLAKWGTSLAETLSVECVDVVAYVRPQWAYAESLYSQQIKGGRTSAAFDEAILSDEYARRFDYKSIFSPWAGEFGDALSVRPFRDDKLIGQDVVADFWEVTSLGDPPVRKRARRNLRLGERGIEMLRSLRAFLEEYGLLDLVPLRKAFSDAGLLIEERLPKDEPFVGLTAGLLAELEERYRRDNKEFVQKFMREEHLDLFDASYCPTRSTPVWRMSEATREERGLFGEIVSQSLSSFAD